VAKRQRRLSRVDDLVISLVAKGLTTGEVQAHLAEIYGAEVSRDTFSTITDRVLDGLAEWQSRPLDLHGVRCLGRFRPCPIRTGCPRLFSGGCVEGVRIWTHDPRRAVIAASRRQAGP
jgi:hypothetical protein